MNWDSFISSFPICISLSRISNMMLNKSCERGCLVVLLNDFIMHIWVWMLLNGFSVCVDHIIFFFSLLIWHITVIHWILKKTGILGIYPTWSWCIILFLNCWIPFANIWWRFLCLFFWRILVYSFPGQSLMVLVPG